MSSLLRNGLTDRHFSIVGSTFFGGRDGSETAGTYAMERRDRPDGQERMVPVALPSIGGLLQHTLEAGQTVRVTPATRDLYLRDCPDLAGFMDAHGLEEGIFSPVAGSHAVGTVFALAEGEALADDVVSRVDELAALTGIAFHYTFGVDETMQKIERLENDLQESRSFDSQILALIQHVLEGGPLHELVRRLAQQINAPVLVEDSSYVMLSFAWPSGSPDLSLDDHERLLLSAPLQDPEVRSELQDLAESVEPRYLELPQAFPYARVRAMVPLVVEGEIVGYLSSLRNDRTTDAEPDRRLSLAAGFVGLYMIRSQTAGEVRHRLSGELINDLLGGRRDESVMSRLRRLGYDLTPPFHVAVLGWREHRWRRTSANGPTSKMVMGLVSDVISRRHPGALIEEKDGVILFTIGAEEERQAIDLASRAVTAIQGAFPETNAFACVSRRCNQTWDMETAYAEAIKVLRLIEDSGGEGRVVSASHLGSYTALLQTDNVEELYEFATQWLEPLRAYDAEKNAELLATLHSYLRNWGHQGNTAAECSVHISTLKYRLQRIEQIGGIELSDPETRTQAQFACQILRAIDVLQGDAQ